MGQKAAVVDPLTLRYKGKRLFQPAHMLVEGMQSSPDILLQQLSLTAVTSPVKCIPVLATIMELCKDVAGYCEVDSGVDDFPEFTTKVLCERLLASPDLDTKLIASSTGSSIPLHILSAAEIQAERWLLHVDRPMFFPNDESPDAIALKVKLMLACNRVIGVQSFVVAMPYVCLFSIPHLHTGRAEDIRWELMQTVQRVFREDYEVRLREEHKKKRDTK